MGSGDALTSCSVSGSTSGEGRGSRDGCACSVSDPTSGDLEEGQDNGDGDACSACGLTSGDLEEVEGSGDGSKGELLQRGAGPPSAPSSSAYVPCNNVDSVAA